MSKFQIKKLALQFAVQKFVIQAQYLLVEACDAEMLVSVSHSCIVTVNIKDWLYLSQPILLVEVCEAENIVSAIHPCFRIVSIPGICLRLRIYRGLT